MAGTMSEKELKINCRMKIGAKLESLSRNTNAAAMVLVGNVMYMAKAHANENGKIVYKSMILKSNQFASGSIGNDEKVAEINYFVYGMTATADKLYCTCKNNAGEPGILEMKMNTSGQKFTKLNATYVGIDIYKDGEFILMKQLDENGTESMKFVTGSLNELKNGTGVNFTVNANDAIEYKKANDIYYDCNQGLFILTNHYLDSDKYKTCQNRILLVKPETYVKDKTYYPHAVFQLEQDTTTYSQFNFEGITLYKNNIWVLSNVIETTGKKEADCIGYMPGITFKKWDESVNKKGNGYFSFNGSTKTGALLSNYTITGTECKNVESMAMDESGCAYCLKCSTDNKGAVLLASDNPETGTGKVVKKASYEGKNCLYHCNGMTYNPEDKRIYVCGYDKSNSANIKNEIFAIDKNGKIVDRYDSEKPQYGIAFYKKNADETEFLLMNQNRTAATIPFDVAVLKKGVMSIKENKFRLEFGRKEGETLQDIFYHSSYGMLFPVTVSDGMKNKVTIYHVSKEQIADAIENCGVVKPDFAIVLDKSSKYEFYEIESMDIAPGSKQMVMCGNFKLSTATTEADSFETLKTLTFLV